MLQNVAVYPIERDTFHREYIDNCYKTITFLLSYTVLEVPFSAITALCFGALSAYPVNLSRTPTAFLVSSLGSFTIVSCGESLGIMFNTLFSHTGFALNITSLILTIATVMGGVMSLNIPSWLQAFNYLSPVKYQIASMAAYSLRGQEFSCRETQKVNGLCPLQTGEQVLDLYNLDGNPKLNLVALGICCVAYRSIAFLFVWIMKKR